MLRWFGVSMVVACVLPLGWGPAGAATPQRAAFTVTLTGTLTKDWTVARVVEGDCTETTTTTGQWRLTLRTTRRSRVVFTSAGRGRPLRISPGVVRSIAGTATQGGSVRVVSGGPRCVRTLQRRNCAQQRATFSNATARLTSPGRGTARFARMQGAARARSFRGTCPEEPADIRAIRTDLALAGAPLAAGDVFGRDVPRFFISGDTTQTTTIEGEYDGKVTERVRWTLTFTRVR
ncbi:MAG TPA: hypothetical protein VFL61_13225 [Gaiellaceae bacterium]|nr:hypothetical protein [Gaiellaceae bacterium]